MSIIRKLDPASPHYLHCYTLDELAAYLYGEVNAEKRAAVFYHLNQEKCERCRNLCRIVGESGQSENDRHPVNPPVDSSRLDWLKRKKMKTFTLPPTPISLEKGQVWVSSCEARDAAGRHLGTVEYAYPVMIVDSGSGTMTFDNSIRIVPLSVDTDFVWPGHSLLLLKDNPLGYPCLVEIFNERPMLAGNLKTFCGSLNVEDVQRFKHERNIWLMGNVNEPDAEVRAWETRELELSSYLSFPVNEMIWEDEEMEELLPGSNDGEMLPVLEVQESINLDDYALAAATDECNAVPLSDIRDYPLYTDDELDVVLLQERDRVTLVITLPESEPEHFAVNTEEMKLEKQPPDQYLFTLSQESVMAGNIRISFVVGQQPYVFAISFSGFSYSSEPE